MGVHRFRQGVLTFCGRVQVDRHGPGKKSIKKLNVESNDFSYAMAA